MAHIHPEDENEREITAAATATAPGDGAVREEKTDVDATTDSDGSQEKGVKGAKVDLKHQQSLLAPRASRLVEGDTEPELEDEEHEREDPNRPLLDQAKLDMKLLKEKIAG